MRKKLSIFSLTAAMLIMILASSCRKEENFNTDSSLKLEFSADTLYFDTVFSTVGSVTLQIRVFNPTNDYINISSVRILGSTASNFRVNVNGMSGTAFQDVEIGPRDSIFVFAEVTVDPGNLNNPFVISDSIEFLTNGNYQYVSLVAWGQDAYFHYPDHPETQYLPAYSLVSGTWANDKPHVVYGYAVVDEDSVLIIPPGTQVYMHNDAVLWVYDGGSLRVNGALGNEVTFTGDRLDEYYKDLPGMWGKIWLSAGSIDNVIDYAIIKNGRIGIQVDTTGASSNPTLTISNTIIDNMSTAAFYAQGSYVKAENCVFGRAGYYSLVLAIGGDYDFRHCTIGNYWSESTRSTPALVLNNYYEDVFGTIQIRDLTNTYFGNCIIYGQNTDELLLDGYSGGGVFNYHFQNCILRTTLGTSGAGFTDCFKNQDPGFTDTENGDFSTSSGSFGVDKGAFSAMGALGFDIEGNTRPFGSTNPDIGPWETQ